VSTRFKNLISTISYFPEPKGRFPYLLPFLKRYSNKSVANLKKIFEMQVYISWIVLINGQRRIAIPTTNLLKIKYTLQNNKKDIEDLPSKAKILYYLMSSEGSIVLPDYLAVLTDKSSVQEDYLSALNSLLINKFLDFKIISKVKKISKSNKSVTTAPVLLYINENLKQFEKSYMEKSDFPKFVSMLADHFKVDQRTIRTRLSSLREFSSRTASTRVSKLFSFFFKNGFIFFRIQVFLSKLHPLHYPINRGSANEISS